MHERIGETIHSTNDRIAQCEYNPASQRFRDLRGAFNMLEICSVY
jgi:hypothetical protein